MKKFSILFLLLYIWNITLSIGINANKTSLSGKITDKTTGEPMLGVVVYIPDLKTGAVTDLQGVYSINNLPSIKVIVKVSYLGYKTILENIDLNSLTTKDFVMESSHIDIHEIVITGTSRSMEVRKDPVPIITVDKKYMDQHLSTNIIDALARVPGVNAVTTGPNVSKPFIRGLGYNRILTLYDGVRQEGQQWGDEHGIEIDQFAIDRIEVIKGPASLTYGSDALGGVVNLLPSLPVPEGTVKGSVVSNYHTNNRQYALSTDIGGTKNGINWGGRITHKAAMNYQNKYDGRVYGTGFQETDVNAFAGINRHWGYSHLGFSLFDAIQEIPDGTRDSATRKFTKQISEADTVRQIVSDGELNSYKISALHQRVQHYRLYSSNNFILGSSKLALKLGYQQSIRREFNHPLQQDIAGLYLFLQTYTYDAKFSLPEWHQWESTIGVNGMFQLNSDKGTRFIIPEYSLFDFGPFVYVKRAFHKLDLSGGFRYDNRFFNNSEMYTKTDPATGFETQVSKVNMLSATRVFSNYKHTFSGASGSIGATYNFNSKFLIKVNVARGFRAPNIAEISANGVHPGTNIYQLGNPNFLPEFSLQEDIGLAFSSDHVSGNLSLFNNDISNYIYNQKVLNSQKKDSIIVQGNQTFQFQAAKAQLYGAEFSLDIHPHPLDWLHFENAISLVYGLNKGVNGIPLNDSTKYLPNIPPLHTNSELRVDIKKIGNRLATLYIKVGFEYYATQNRAYLANNTETPTNGYVLMNAGIGTDVKKKSGTKLFSIHLLVNNLLDAAYQSNLSRLKYFEKYPSNTSGRSGIYNMGRNFGVKVIIPFR
jgi:iron complex outermembrane receptor protein